MANPNKTVAKFLERRGRDPKAVAACHARAMKSPMVVDIGKFQNGEMTAEQFEAKWKK